MLNLSENSDNPVAFSRATLSVSQDYRIDNHTDNHTDNHIDYGIDYGVWQLPSQPLPRGIVHIIHGMAEHLQRYDHFARYLVNQGYMVYAHNQRGHGENCPASQLGFLGHQDGWQNLQHDMVKLHRHIRAEHGDTPLYLLGHSMGSFVTLDYLIDNGHQIDAAILSGSNYAPPWLYQGARLITALERCRLGATGRSQFIDKLTFVRFNRRFKPNRTPCDWLSRDSNIVDQYIADPFCGFLCTTQLWHDLFSALASMSTRQRLQKIPSDLPVLIVGGREDPTSYPHGLTKLADNIRAAGVADVQCQIYAGGRHEILNEINRQQVYDAILQWLNQRTRTERR